MKHFTVIALLTTAAAFGQDHATSPLKYETALSTAWKMSLAPLVAAHSLDVASSWGYVETNPLLAGPDGRFGMQSAGIKLGIVAGAVLVEYLLLRRHPKMAKLFTRANYFNATITGGIAARNYAVTH